MERLSRKAEWFDTSIVIRKVLGHLCHQEILTLSTVNKFWNVETKGLLKADGKTLAKLDSFTACQDLFQFAKILESMDVIPFSGFNINVQANHSGSCTKLSEADFNLLSSRISAKTLRINARATDRSSCSAVETLERLLLANAHQLVELSIIVPSTSTLIIESFATNIRKFKQLKVLRASFPKLHKSQLPTFLDFLKSVWRNAPKLEQLQLECHRRLECWRSSEALVIEALEGNPIHFIYDEMDWLLWKIPIRSLQHVAARSFKDSARRVNWTDELDAKTTFFQSSAYMLHTATFNTWSIAQIILDGLQLPKLQEMKLTINYQFVQKRHTGFWDPIFCADAWKRCFPKLKCLAIVIGCMREGDYEFLSRLMKSRQLSENTRNSNAETAKHSRLKLNKLSISGDAFSPTGENCAFLETLCCHIEHLIIDCYDITEVAPVFHCLKCVETLELVIHQPESRIVDAVLCGVHPEEVGELKWKDVEYLKAVYIVPIRPSLLHAKNLKKLIIRQRSSVGRCGFTSVSAGVCFYRLPNFVVELNVVQPDSDLGAAKIKHFLDVMSDFPQVIIELQGRGGL